MDGWMDRIRIIRKNSKHFSEHTFFPWEKNNVSHIVEQTSRRLLDVMVATDNPMQGVAFQL